MIKSMANKGLVKKYLKKKRKEFGYGIKNKHKVGKLVKSKLTSKNEIETEFSPELIDLINEE